MSLKDTDDLAIFTPTDRGKAELKAGSTKLSTIALELMVMFDGKTPMSAIVKRFAGARAGEIGDAVTALLRGKLIDIVSGKTAEADFGAMFEVPVETVPESVPAETRDEAEKGMLSRGLRRCYIGARHLAAAKNTPDNA